MRKALDIAQLQAAHPKRYWGLSRSWCPGRESQLPRQQFTCVVSSRSPAPPKALFCTDPNSTVAKCT